jgi:glycosyltransferase involved in cell wall biosynthesis
LALVYQKISLKKLGNIKILSFIKNPYKIISESQILVAPLFEGAGVKVKVIESLACGTPVVGTEIAFEGIEFDKGLYLARRPTEYVQIIKELFNDVDLKYKNELRMEFLKFYQDYEKKLDYILIKKLRE